MEDSFFNSDFDFKEIDYKRNSTLIPLFFLTVKQNDTVINYKIKISDCQNYHTLINYNKEIKDCAETFIGIKDFKSNYDSIPNDKAKQILNLSLLTN